MALIDRLSSLVTAERGGQPLPQEADLPADLITGVVTAMDRVPERVRASEPGWVHVSSLSSFCPRRMVLLRRNEHPLVRSVTGGHRVMWRIGRAVEAHIREQYIRGHNYRGILGRWTCLCGSTNHVGRYRAGETCNRCNQPVNVYGEYTLRDPSLMLVGNPDLLVEHGLSMVVVEIKSMVKEQWDALMEPLGEHIFQAGMYYDLAQTAGLRPHRKAAFIYCTKNFKFGSPYKEFHVNVATESRLRQRQMVREALREALQHEQEGTLPVRTVCASATTTTAKACPMVTACFSM